MKPIDLNKNVYELTEEYPELTEVLKELGFLGVANPVVRKTMGKKTTIPQGAKMQGKNMDDVLAYLKEKGFTVS